MDSNLPGESVGPVFDNLDVDLVVKVLNHTAFSPFFIFLVPIFFIFQEARIDTRPVFFASVYWVLVCTFWLLKWYSRLYRNQGSILFGPPPLDWGEQIVVITGGASGIGELLANTLAVRNVNVIVLDVKPIVTENYNITYYKCDVSKWEEVEAISKQIVEDIGHPTMLINNAGVVQGKLITDLTPEDIKQTFNVNTLSHYWTLKAFLPEMIKEKTGHIVTVGSVAGLVGATQMADYSASKAALIPLHESLRYELDKRYHAPGVRTTLVIPGHVLTPLFSTVDLPKSWLYNFFVPSQAPITIVKAIIAALDERHSQVIYLPFYANFAPYLWTMPSFIRDLGQWMSRADEAMKPFVKVSGRRADEGPVPTVAVETRLKAS
ncbi:retinal short-chain dehydrogenase/reductase [Amylostereum chailletii]|nr:retinal short-chain dehydrogenase/reductase [Amylostereum chailletii]